MKSMTVQLVKKTLEGTDPFGAPIYKEELINVPGCLVGPGNADQIIQATEKYGKKVAYTIGVPKGDTHNWIDTDVIFYGERFHTIGLPEKGMPENIPLYWGQNVMVERYG